MKFGSNHHILLVEDEMALGETLSDYLQERGFKCTWAQSYNSAIEKVRNIDTEQFIAILDIGLPDGDGLQLAKVIKQSCYASTIIFLSAQNDPCTRVTGLEIGAIDFINKPFQLKELELRLQGILTRKSIPRDHIEIHKNLTIWFEKFEIEYASNKKNALSNKECEILQLLYQNKDHAVSREEIIRTIWGEDAYPSNRTVDNYIVQLRKLLDEDPISAVSIQSIRGVGYKLIITPPSV
ncbi:response regulator transcription factor [Bacteriovoracaceae bacterium]|nr:response regulator transcription factor [Bacteriovoracaceae bacterium]